MNTTNIMEDYRKISGLTQNRVKLSGVELDEGIIEDTVLMPEEEGAEGVSLQISDEGKQKALQLQNMKMYAEQLQESKKNAEEAGEETVKVMTVFRRIANGDIVPAKDEKKLMEYSFEMYQAAKNLACLKQSEERKKYKSVDDEEEDESIAVSQEEAIRTLTDSDSSGNANVSDTKGMDSFEGL